MNFSCPWRSRLRIPRRFPGAAVPQQHGAAAVLALGDDALELAVLERVILDVHRQPLVGRVEAGPLRHRPALQHAVQLEPEVVVQAARRVLLDHERERSRAALRAWLARRLR